VSALSSAERETLVNALYELLIRVVEEYPDALGGELRPKPEAAVDGSQQSSKGASRWTAREIPPTLSLTPATRSGVISRGVHRRLFKLAAESCIDSPPSNPGLSLVLDHLVLEIEGGTPAA
jgi:hypothetical protein